MNPKSTSGQFERYLKTIQLRQIHRMLPEEPDVSRGYYYEPTRGSVPYHAASATTETLLLVGGLVAVIAIVLYIGNAQTIGV